MRGASAWAWVLAVFAVLLGVLVIVLNGLAGSDGDPWWHGVLASGAVLASAAVGVVVALRRPENPIGWLLLVNGVLLSVYFVASAYANYALLARPGEVAGGSWAALWEYAGWATLFAPFAAIAFVFPDGRLPSPRWRAVAFGGVGVFVLVVASQMVHPAPFDRPFEDVGSPLPDAPEALIPVFEVLLLGLLATLVAAVSALRARRRRASAIERVQIRWLVYAGGMIPVTFVVCIAGWALTGVVGDATVAAITLAHIAISFSIGVAVLRYRLYEIDRLVNRTLVYFALSILLAGTYLVVSLAVGVIVGGGSTLPTAAASVAVALMFGRLRRRVQRLVDRRFSRERYVGLRMVERHLEELRDGRATPEATGQVLAAALDDPTLELLFWLPDRDILVDASGREVAVASPSGRALTPVYRGDLRLGAIVHDPVLGEHPDLLESVIEAAGLAIEIARLRAEVRRRLSEVEESRARIVTAGYEERTRLERDLHDGAQQRLVAIGLGLRNIQAELPAGAKRTRASLNDTVDQLSDAVDELRELARGVRPACLDDGLHVALHDLASRSPLPTAVDATSERFEAQVEAAAYFVAMEGLTNAIKHAQASHVKLTAARENGCLVVSVSDDGIGGAAGSERSGLAGIADRVAALGGTLHVTSPAAAGTAVVAELPCAS